jgi:hypothetical protein
MGSDPASKVVVCGNIAMGKELRTLLGSLEIINYEEFSKSGRYLEELWG